MDEAALEHYIRSYIEQQNYPEIVFHWQGGEPTLLGVNYFRDVVRLQKQYCPEGVTIRNNLQTNGILLDDEWCRFLAKNNFLVGLSIDGPELIHNTYRVNRAGRGTFAQTMKGVSFLHKHDVSFATLTCVNNITAANALEVYRFLRDVVKSSQMQFIPIVEPKSFRHTAPQHWQAEEIVFQGMPETEPSHPNSIVEPWCVSDQQWGEFLCAVFDEWLENDIGQINVPYFEACVEAWMGRVNRSAPWHQCVAKAWLWKPMAMSIPATITSIHNTSSATCTSLRWTNFSSRHVRRALVARKKATCQNSAVNANFSLLALVSVQKTVSSKLWREKPASTTCVQAGSASSLMLTPISR